MADDNVFSYSLGDGYLSKSFPAPMGTAKDLTFVSVLDKEGRPLRQASTVEVWNTHKNNIKTYPVIGKKAINAPKFFREMTTLHILKGSKNFNFH